ncbi:MAG: MobA/MobL family protein [Pigmentiphaga sp.]
MTIDDTDSFVRRDKLAVTSRAKSGLRDRELAQQRAQLDAERKGATSAALRLRPLSGYRFKPPAESAHRVVGSHAPNIWRHKGVSGHFAGRKNDNRARIRFSRGAAQALAYICGETLIDAVTGEQHDYTDKDVVYRATKMPADLKLPAGAVSRADLAREIERAAYKKSENLGLEIIDPIDSHLIKDGEKRGDLDRLLRELADRRAQQLSDATGTAAVAAVHPPDEAGDQRNWHMHVYLPTRKLIVGNGQWRLGAKLDHMQKGARPERFAHEVVRHWGDVQMQVAHERGLDLVLDFRSNRERGVASLPTVHVGRGSVIAAQRGYQQDAIELNDSIRRINEVAARSPAVAALIRDELDRRHREHSSEARRERRALVRQTPVKQITNAIEKALPPSGQKRPMPLPIFMGRLLAQGVAVQRPSVASGGNLNGLRFALLGDPMRAYTGKDLAVHRNGKKMTPYTFPRLLARGLEYDHARDHADTQDPRALTRIAADHRAELAPTPAPTPERQPPSPMNSLDNARQSVARLERAIDDLDLEL